VQFVHDQLTLNTNKAAIVGQQNTPVDFFPNPQILFQNIPIFDYFFKINFKKF